MKKQKMQQKVAEKLLIVKKELLAIDRTEAQKALGISKSTISRYLNNGVKDPTLGIGIFNYFLSRINERKKLVEELVHNNTLLEKDIDETAKHNKKPNKKK